jgi:AbrB family looped-hinge helix DNA binding protein
MRDPKQEPRATDLFYGAVTIGERGQIVIPAEARKHNSLAPGDKLLVFRHPHIHGMVLARLDDVEALLGELREWVRLVSQVREETAAAEARPTRKKQQKGR